MNKKAVYIVEARRTAIGSLLGSLGKIPAVELGSLVIRAIIKESGLDPILIDEVIMGQVITGVRQQHANR